MAAFIVPDATRWRGFANFTWVGRIRRQFVRISRLFSRKAEAEDGEYRWLSGFERPMRRYGCRCNPDDGFAAPTRIAGLIGDRDEEADEPVLDSSPFPPRQCKNPRLLGGGFWLREPDDYLLSHGNPHYHRRRVVSRSCSGWEGVGPTRYGHQAKRVVALLRNATNLGRSSNFELCVSHTRIQPVALDRGRCLRTAPIYKADLL